MRLINKLLNKGYLKIESRKDLSEDEKISQIIHSTSVAGAVAVIQPFPFVDLLTFTPILAFMIEKISSIRGERLKEKEAKKLVKKIWGYRYWVHILTISLGKGYFFMLFINLGFNFTTSLSSLIGSLSFLIGPLVFLIIYLIFLYFIMTIPYYIEGYAIGKTADRYFLLKLKNQSLTAKDMKKELNQFLNEGRQKTKKYRTDKEYIKRIKTLFKRNT